MKYPIALIVINLLVGSASGQEKNTTNTSLPMYPYKAHFAWSSYKKQNDTLVQQFMKVAPKLLPNEYLADHPAKGMFSENVTKEYAAKFLKAFTIVDFNGDGLDDLIYTGDSGGEPQEVAFILNTGKGFKVVFTEDQVIEKLDFENGKLTNVYLIDGGCCEDNIDFRKIYHVDYKGVYPHFKNVYTTASIQKTYMHETFFDKPIYFEVLNDNYKMRVEPFIQDNIVRRDVVMPGKLKGNTIDTLVKGTRGRAIAAHTDTTGRVWWLIEVDRGYNKYGHYFYGQQGNMFYKEAADTTHKAARVGWISSRYVKKLEE